MKRVLLVLATFFLQPGRTFAQAPCQAKLDLRWHGQLLAVTGSCRSLLTEPARYRYQLVVVRQGPAGRSQNSQGGQFSLLPQQTAVLSEVRFNTGSKDFFQARLLVFDLNGHQVAQDSAGQGFPQH